MLPLNSSTILIIDDSSTNVVLLEAILQEEGYSTETAYGAKEAFKIIDKHHPDLILLDLLMPQINGFEFLEKLKMDEKTKNIPVIVVSAVGTKENIDKCRELSVNDFFTKPIDIPTFIMKVGEYINRK